MHNNQSEMSRCRDHPMWVIGAAEGLEIKVIIVQSWVFLALRVGCGSVDLCTGCVKGVWMTEGNLVREAQVCMV